MNRKIRTTITLPRDMHDRLKREAFEQHISLNDHLLHKLEDSKKPVITISPLPLGVKTS